MMLLKLLSSSQMSNHCVGITEYTLLTMLISFFPHQSIPLISGWRPALNDELHGARLRGSSSSPLSSRTAAKRGGRGAMSALDLLFRGWVLSTSEFMTPSPLTVSYTAVELRASSAHRLLQLCSVPMTASTSPEKSTLQHFALVLSQPTEKGSCSAMRSTIPVSTK